MFTKFEAEMKWDVSFSLKNREFVSSAYPFNSKQFLFTQTVFQIWSMMNVFKRNKTYASRSACLVRYDNAYVNVDQLRNACFTICNDCYEARIEAISRKNEKMKEKLQKTLPYVEPMKSRLFGQPFSAVVNITMPKYIELFTARAALCLFNKEVFMHS